MNKKPGFSPVFYLEKGISRAPISGTTNSAREVLCADAHVGDIEYVQQFYTRRTRHGEVQGAAALVERRTEYDARECSAQAAYAQDEWNVTDRWSVYFGLRWEGVNIKGTGTDYGSIDNNSSVFSPLIQTRCKLGERRRTKCASA